MRTLVDIPRVDRSWLDRQAKKEGISMAEMVRRAVRKLRDDTVSPREKHRRLLQAAQGHWKRGDGLKWQLKMRKEWDR